MKNSLHFMKYNRTRHLRSLIVTARKRSLQRLCFYRVCQSTGGVHGRGCAWPGVVRGRGHVWQGVCMVGGVHGGGMCGRGHAWHICHPPGRYCEIRSMSWRYASYWNAFLFSFVNCMKNRE